MSTLSRRAYARHRKKRGLPGQSLQAVQHALARGRISLLPDGTIDPSVADREWAENSDDDHRRNHAQERGVEREPERPEPAAGGITLAQATTIEKAYKAKMAKLDYEERCAKLVQASDVESRLATTFGQCRTKLLGIPAQARQQDPTLSAPQVALFRSLIREALEDLGGGGAGDEAEEAAP